MAKTKGDTLPLSPLSAGPSVPNRQLPGRTRSGKFPLGSIRLSGPLRWHVPYDNTRDEKMSGRINIDNNAFILPEPQTILGTMRDGRPNFMVMA